MEEEAYLRGGRGARTTTVPDDDVTAAAASRDAVATNATNAIGPRERVICVRGRRQRHGSCIVPRLIILLYSTHPS